VNNDVSWANFSTPANASMIGAGALEIKAGNTLYVDAVNGDNASAVAGRFDKPYLTIAAAIGAASANDLVLVRPGTYDETSIVLPTGVTLAGEDRLRCIIYHTTLDTTTVVTMGQDTSLENMTIRGASPASPSGRTLVEFPGTTSNSSVARNLVLEGRAGNVNALSVSGSGTSAQNWVTCDMVDVKGVGLSNGLVSSSTGFFIVRDCLLSGLVGCSISSGNVELQDTKCQGVIGLNIAAGSTVYVNQSTRWLGTTPLANAGSLLSAGDYLTSAGASPAFANYYHSTSYAGIKTTASTLPFDPARITDAAFTLSSNELTINTAGTYRVDFGCSSDDSENDDNTIEIWLELDSGGGFGEVGGTRARWFHDSGEEEGGNASFAILELDATDVLRVRGQVVDGVDQIDTLAGSLRLSIQTVGANGATGPQGPQGPAGSGSTVNVQDEGTNLPNTPHSTLNFVGAGVTATDAGSGVATITIPGGSAGANIAQYLRSSNQLISTTASPIIFDVSNFEDSNYSRTGELITILTAGVYSISYSVYFDTNANARRTVDCWVDRSVNSGVSYSEIVPSRAASYSRNATDDTSNTTCTFFVDLGVNDIIRLIADSTGTAGSANGIANRMWISLQYLRA